MPSHRRLFSCLGPIFALLTFLPVVAYGKETLFTFGERVTIFTGPGKFYRPLIVLPPGRELQTSKSTIKNKHGEFFRVLVRLSNKKKAIGYIPVDAEVRLKTDNDIAEDIESFREYPLAERSIQFSNSQFKTQRSLATLGFLRYLGPGFYLKGFGGVFLSPGNTSPVVGGEFGNDALLHRNLSGFTSLALGVFLKPELGALFEGNKKDFSNLLIQTAIGIRYNFSNIASVSVGGTQAALFSPNNSLVTFGGLITIEWGL